MGAWLRTANTSNPGVFMTENARIMVIDDDQAICEFLNDALTDEGFSVAITYSGLAALAIIDEFNPNLILLDMLMPKMDGQQFLEISRARYPSIPIIGCSASRSVEKRARLLGAADFLEKPFNLETLFICINHHLQ